MLLLNWYVLHLGGEGPSWSWSYGNRIYYICNQYISPITLLVRTPLRRCVLDTTLCNKVCQWLAAGRLFSPGPPVSSTNKTDRHDIAEILLKVALNAIPPPSHMGGDIIIKWIKRKEKKPHHKCYTVSTFIISLLQN